MAVKFKQTKSSNQKIQPKPNGISKDTQRLKGLEKNLPTKWRAKINKQKAGVAILTFDKIDCKATKIQW